MEKIVEQGSLYIYGEPPTEHQRCIYEDTETMIFPARLQGAGDQPSERSRSEKTVRQDTGRI